MMKVNQVKFWCLWCSTLHLCLEYSYSGSNWWDSCGTMFSRKLLWTFYYSETKLHRAKSSARAQNVLKASSFISSTVREWRIPFACELPLPFQLMVHPHPPRPMLKHTCSHDRRYARMDLIESTFSLLLFPQPRGEKGRRFVLWTGRSHTVWDSSPQHFRALAITFFWVPCRELQ